MILISRKTLSLTWLTYSEGGAPALVPWLGRGRLANEAKLVMNLLPPILVSQQLAHAGSLKQDCQVDWRGQRKGVNN